jgi:hypothetical protein
MEKPLAPLPIFKPYEGSPALVLIHDKIRRGPLCEQDEYLEFWWFSREYPRVYRHHLDHAEYRLSAIQRTFQEHHAKAATLIRRESEGWDEETSTYWEYSYRDPTVPPIYWDFESYLQAISSALDIAARIAGTAFKQNTPPNFNRFCKTVPDGDLRDLFLRAKRLWVKRMKEYRDCFTHFTPAETLLMLHIKQYADVFQLRGKIPVNPQARDILDFRYSRRVELFHYATTVWKHMVAFDRAVATLLWRKYKQGAYPKQLTGLFFVGQRTQS